MKPDGTQHSVGHSLSCTGAGAQRLCWSDERGVSGVSALCLHTARPWDKRDAFLCCCERLERNVMIRFCTLRVRELP